MAQKVEIDGVEVEVYTAAEVQEREKTAADTAVAARESEFGKTKTQIESERDEARKALAERTQEFGKFRALNAEQITKLTEAERALYENQQSLNQERERTAAVQKTAHEAAIASAIRNKTGADQKLFDKVQGMWDVINVETITPEQIEKKINMVLGAIGTTEPDLLASVAGFSGSYTPPQVNANKDKAYGETDAGKAAAAELGLKI